MFVQLIKMLRTKGETTGMEKSASQMLDSYIDTVSSGVLSTLIWVVLGLILVFAVMSWIKRRREAGTVAVRYDTSHVDPSAIPIDDPLHIPAPVIRHAQRPTDGGEYAAIRAFAEEKHRVGDAVIEEERFAMGPLAVVETLLGDVGLIELDGFGDAAPYKGWELRQAMERIDLPEIGGFLEQAVAIFLHRLQLTNDMTETGMPIEQARVHHDMPQYDALDARIGEAGGLDAFRAAADRYFAAAYPWADQA